MHESCEEIEPLGENLHRENRTSSGASGDEIEGESQWKRRKGPCDSWWKNGFVTAPAISVRITRESRARSNQSYVCVEATLSTDASALYLFRQGDGTWDVSPPDAEHPAMSV